MDNSAIPIPASGVLKTYKKLEPEAVTSRTEPRDLNYFRLCETEGWKQLKDDITSMIDNLDSVVKLENAQNISDFGFMVLARDLAKTYLKGVISMVETSHAYVQNLEENVEK